MLQRTLKKEGLKGCRPRKISFYCKTHKSDYIFARKYIDKEIRFWSSVSWSNETKIELFGHGGISFVCRKKVKLLNLKALSQL